MSRAKKSFIRPLHDRRLDPADRPYGARTASVIVRDAYDKTHDAVVTASLRDDPLLRLKARGHIDEAQFAAGRRFQKAAEDAEIGYLRANDTTKEPVDGGGISPEPITDKTKRAVRILTDCRATLGIEGYSILCDALIRRMTFEEVANGRGLWRPRDIEFIGRRFRACLEELVRLFGLAGGGGARSGA